MENTLDDLLLKKLELEELKKNMVKVCGARQALIEERINTIQELKSSYLKALQSNK